MTCESAKMVGDIQKSCEYDRCHQYASKMGPYMKIPVVVDSLYRPIQTVTLCKFHSDKYMYYMKARKKINADEFIVSRHDLMKVILPYKRNS